MQFVNKIHLATKAVGEEMGEDFLVVAVEQEAALGVGAGPVLPKSPLTPPSPRRGEGVFKESANVSTCWAGNAVTRESGRLPTQVSMGRPLAAVIFISVFFGGGDSTVCFDAFGVFAFFFALLTAHSLSSGTSRFAP